MRAVTIDPVTRIEGHAKISIFMDENGEVADAQLNVTQIRGFERFTAGRPFYEMPSITARICGICPVSHLLASSKACDAIMAVKIPEPGFKLRQLVHKGQIIQSHALSFFHLSAPDLLLGFDSDPAKRNVLGLLEKFPDAAKQGVWLRKFGQQIIEWISHDRVHPHGIVPGGMSDPLSKEVRDRILTEMPYAIKIAEGAVKLLSSMLDQFPEEIAISAISIPCIWASSTRTAGWPCMTVPCASWTPKARSSRKSPIRTSIRGSSARRSSPGPT
ncbi:nickel-dependent hydrogenase large subunit [Roseovarius pacificus]|uniref:nickel-dependent hydrogenase large subunit n=1 Tax=Roseovarius pacificus TaxID=337701 RepID=UPI002A188172|nr:nickel-dependent hydrogenase large subunit [Roseovarius pacificus]